MSNYNYLTMIILRRCRANYGELTSLINSCENVTRDTAVEVPGYRDTQQELEEMRETCEEIVRSLPEDQWQTLLEWMAKLEDMNSMEGQKAYCQGYVDCILLLSGLGLFRQEISPEELIKQIQ